MSIHVISEVLRHSRAEHGERLVLIALADGASKDEGVTWVGQRSLMELTLLSEKAVRDSLRALEEMVEIETRLARREGKRTRFNCYRVLVGRYAHVEIDPGNLPLLLFESFSRPADIAARRAQRLDALAATGVAAERAARPAETAARQDGDDRQNPTATTGRIRRSRPAESAALSRARSSLLDPEGEPEGTRQQDARGAGGQVVDAAAAGLELHLRRLRVAPADVALALADPERAQAWLEVARREATDNVAGYLAAGLRQEGVWPSVRGKQPTTALRREQQRRQTIEALIRNLGPVDGADEARYLIDNDFHDLAQVERTVYHELVDELASAQLPEPAAARERGAA